MVEDGLFTSLQRKTHASQLSDHALVKVDY
jgi:hypothetical protein